MFKKILIIIMILLISATLCFSEVRSVLSINGKDWISWKPEFKAFFIIGFLVAHGSLSQAVINSNLSNDFKAKALIFLYFPDDVKSIFTKVEYYYRTTNDLEAPIWSVIYLIYDKGWWNLEENEILNNKVLSKYFDKA